LVNFSTFHSIKALVYSEENISTSVTPSLFKKLSISLLTCVETLFSIIISFFHIFSKSLSNALNQSLNSLEDLNHVITSDNLVLDNISVHFAKPVSKVAFSGWLDLVGSIFHIFSSVSFVFILNTSSGGRLSKNDSGLSLISFFVSF
jgi:hypothetical protein